MKKYKPKNNRGVSLFEVLLYIALFSVVSISLIYLYISIVKSTDSLSLNLQKTELSIFMRQLAQYRIDTIGNTRIANVSALETALETTLKLDIERILRFYPNLKMGEGGINVEYISSDTSNMINTIARVTYLLQTLLPSGYVDGRAGSHSKSFTHVLYIPLL